MKRLRRMETITFQKINKDKNLALGAKSLFRDLWELADENWEVTLKNRELNDLTGFSTRSISRNIRLLVKHGYIISNTNPAEDETLLWKRKITIIKEV